MRKNKLYCMTVLLLGLTIGLTSCLNDPNIEEQEYGLINLNANKIIEIPSDASHIVSKTLLPSGTVDITISEVRLAAEQPATEDILVTLAVDNSGYTDGEALFPLDKIDVPTNVTIKKGTRSTPIVVKVNTDFLLSDPQYIAIKIAKVDKPGYIISGNFGLLKVNFKIKHKYEGRYVLSGTLQNLRAGDSFHHISELFDPDPYTCQLQTVDGSTLIFYEEIGWEDYIYPMMTATGGYSGFGSFCPQFTFDANGNITAVTNAYGQPAGNTRSAELDPAGVNKYDEATKSFQVSYWMNQPSAVPTAPYHRCHMVETYTFKEDL